MINLNDLIVCPVCHAGLPLDRISKEGLGCCPTCGRRYTFKRGVYNMTPHPPPDGVVQSKWGAWQRLQDNGLLFYTRAPEFNLSVGPREDALAFKAFCQASGLILDVGCGPQQCPSYLPEGGKVVGIDPLLGEQARGFTFVQGVGEYLPFRNETFDHVLYATSLDHSIDPRRSLSEATRCLKPNGCISLWLDALATSYPSADPSCWARYRMLAKKGLKTLSRRGLSSIGFRRTLWYVGSVARMKVPEGAVDYFHFGLVSSLVVSNWFGELGLTITRREEYPGADSLFIKAKK